MPDPGEPGQRGDPQVSRVVYALRDLGVRGQATAVDVLNAAGGAGLTPAQVAAALAGFPAGRRDWPVPSDSRAGLGPTGGPAYDPGYEPPT